jgi:hypothetical protein
MKNPNLLRYKLIQRRHYSVLMKIKSIILIFSFVPVDPGGSAEIVSVEDNPKFTYEDPMSGLFWQAIDPGLGHGLPTGPQKLVQNCCEMVL